MDFIYFKIDSPSERTAGTERPQLATNLHNRRSRPLADRTARRRENGIEAKLPFKARQAVDDRPCARRRGLFLGGYGSRTNRRIAGPSWPARNAGNAGNGLAWNHRRDPALAQALWYGR